MHLKFQSEATACTRAHATKNCANYRILRAVERYKREPESVEARGQRSRTNETHFIEMPS